MDTSLSLLLLKQIASLFLIAAAGFVLVKCRILSKEDSRVISVICIYLVFPCMIITSYQIELTESVRNGFLLAVAAGLVAQLVMLSSGIPLKLLRLDEVSRGSVMYSNAGNLILPLVSAVLGPEWVIYSTAFMCIQQVSMWVHLNGMIARQKKPEWKKIITNVNVLAIIFAILLMVFRIRIPAVVNTAMTSVGGLLGPMSMLLIGMLLAGEDIKATVKNPQVWLIALLRLIVLPLVVLVVLKLTTLAKLIPDGKMVLYVTMLGISAPAATMVTQFAQIHQNRPEYASAINVLTTLLCILTMPVMTEVYMRFM